MLASTVQFSKYGESPHIPHRQPEHPSGVRRYDEHGALQSKQPHPHDRGRPVPSGPNSVPTTSSPPSHAFHTLPHASVRSTSRTSSDLQVTSRTGQRSTLELRHEHPHPPETGRASRSAHGSGPPSRGERPVLLRKEVIQPHLPVRLPCYDFVPIADPAFDGSLPQGVGPPASGVTDFRDVTGGVYKARERIHRSVADLRLLATPTSWGRVADPNPN